MRIRYPDRFENCLQYSQYAQLQLVLEEAELPRDIIPKFQHLKDISFRSTVSRRTVDPQVFELSQAIVDSQERITELQSHPADEDVDRLLESLESRAVEYYYPQRISYLQLKPGVSRKKKKRIRGATLPIHEIPVAPRPVFNLIQAEDVHLLDRAHLHLLKSLLEEVRNNPMLVLPSEFQVVKGSAKGN